MKVLHVTPSYFAPESLMGGGERYVTELARVQSRRHEVTLVSFGSKRISKMLDNLRLEVFPARYLSRDGKNNPLSISFLLHLWNADVIHCHQIYTLCSDLSVILGKIKGKLVVVTDHGGGGSLVLNTRLPVFDWYSAAIAYSDFGRSALPATLKKKSVLIKGGIDTHIFQPREAGVPRKFRILFVGRLCAHKGVEDLIEAFRLLKIAGHELLILGHPYESAYYTYLQERAAGLDVRFLTDASDTVLREAYQSARVTVLPSRHRNSRGEVSAVPELMGLTLLEAQASGCPVVATRAGAMAEFVREGETGLVVPEANPEALAQALNHVLGLSEDDFRHWSEAARAWAETLNWDMVAIRHEELYQQYRK